MKLFSFLIFCVWNFNSYAQSDSLAVAIDTIENEVYIEKPDTVFMSKLKVSKELYSTDGKVLGSLIRPNDTLYWTVDSTAFSGAIVSTDTISDSKCTNRIVYHCENGCPREMIDYRYLSPTIFLDWNSELNENDFPCYLSQKITNWGQTWLEFDQQGDTIFSAVQMYRDNKEWTHSKEFSEGNFLVREEFDSKLRSLEINEFFVFDKQGRVIEYSLSEQYFDTCVYKSIIIDSLGKEMAASYFKEYCIDSTFQVAYNIDSNRDTILDVTLINGKFAGYNKQFFEDEFGEKVIIESIWDNGLIVDILNEDIIYVSTKSRLVSESRFMELMNEYWREKNFHPLLIPDETADNLEAKVILYTPQAASYMDTPKELEISVNRIVRKQLKYLARRDRNRS